MSITHNKYNMNMNMYMVVI